MKRVQSPSSVVVPAGRVCPRCGAPLGGFGPEGLCGACLFAAGLVADKPTAALDLLADGLRRFGDYELLEEIARGGMGVIFKARQLSLSRIVAVKMILRGEFASVAELARFRVEAETAARLQHPNIVAIHEVGEHAGQPYFSMDYVAGQNLAQLVGNTPLSAARGATYLKTIAEAVQYAHEQGVLHRDLKPSNVLIDANGQPRVTDFGLAKRLNNSELGTEHAEFTSTGQVLGSPSFMPPEQAAGKNDAIGPASDVYSLGAMLYHALTGRPPFLAESMPATLRLVAESEPVSPRLLNDGVPRDLETICLKCLQKEPQRRYGSARELADELNRFFKDEPIRARPATLVEKLWRWSRRNRALAGTLGATSALLLIVAIGSPIMSFRISRERQAAESARQNESELRKQAEVNEKKAMTEAAKSQQVARFMEGMLNGVGPSVALGRDTTMLREILDKTVVRVSTKLKDQPDVEAELLSTIGNVYIELGQYEEAETMHREALVLRRRLFGNEHLDVAESLHCLANALLKERKSGEAESTAREALALRRRLLGEEHEAVAISMELLGIILGSQNKLAEVETIFRETLTMRRKLLGNEHPEVSYSLLNMGWVLVRQGKLAEAEAFFREALELRTKTLGEEHPEVAISLFWLAESVRGQDRLAEAEALYRKAFTMQRKLLSIGHPDTATTLNELVAVLRRQSKLVEVEALDREILALARVQPSNNSVLLADAIVNLTDDLAALQKFSEAERVYGELLTPALEARAGGARPLRHRAHLFARQGRWQEAVNDLAKALKLTTLESANLFDLAPLFLELGDVESYHTNREATLASLGTTSDPDVAMRATKYCLLLPLGEANLATVARWADEAVDQKGIWTEFVKGMAEYRQARFIGAVEWMTKALAGRESDGRDAEAWMILAMARYHLGQADEARAALAKGGEIIETKLPKLDSGDLGAVWPDWIMSRVLMCEAQALIDPARASGIAPSKQTN